MTGHAGLPALLVLGILGVFWIAPPAPVAGGEGPFGSEAALRAAWPDPDAAKPKDGFVGSLDCFDCHEDRQASLETSFHAKLLEDGGGGCEECHGPGSAHVDDGGDGPIRHPRKVPAREVNGVCLSCHARVLLEPVAGHRKWIEAAPDRSCVTCHEVHVDRKAKAFDPKLGPFPDIAALEKQAEYVKGDRCIACHPDFHPQMARSGHKALRTEGKTCGTCHGPGSLHAASGGDPSKIIYPKRQTAKAVNANCNQCHLAGEAVQRWTCAEHHREGLSCIDCHDANARAGRTLRKPEFELCGGCHVDVRAKFRLPGRHRVPEGRVLCSDCHDPHGNSALVRDKDVRLTACVKCHTEKGGPFVYDHAVKRTEGCVACHDPHGSPNRRMLTYQRIKPMCLQCHPETPHDLASPTWNNCIACHIEIHGSDLDRRFLR